MREAIHALKYDRLHPAARRLGECSPRHRATWPDAPANCSSCRCRCIGQARTARLQPGEPLPKRPRRSAQSHPEWRLTLAPAMLMRLRATGARPDYPAPASASTCAALPGSRSRRVAGKHILVVDDILTTGATCARAAQSLHEPAQHTRVRGHAGARAPLLHSLRTASREIRRQAPRRGIGRHRLAGGSHHTTTNHLFDEGKRCRWEKP